MSQYEQKRPDMAPRPETTPQDEHLLFIHGPVLNTAAPVQKEETIPTAIQALEAKKLNNHDADRFRQQFIKRLQSLDMNAANGFLSTEFSNTIPMNKNIETHVREASGRSIEEENLLKYSLPGMVIDIVEKHGLTKFLNDLKATAGTGSHLTRPQALLTLEGGSTPNLADYFKKVLDNKVELQTVLEKMHAAM